MLVYSVPLALTIHHNTQARGVMADCWQTEETRTQDSLKGLHTRTHPLLFLGRTLPVRAQLVGQP